MSKLALYQVDAFTDRVFHGNPAAVCPLREWPNDAFLQKVAAENNLSETAYFVDEGDEYSLRWWTPVVEVDLCGHATLASAHVVFEYLKPELDAVRFRTKSGPVTVHKTGGLLEMDFPARMPERCEAPERLVTGLGFPPVEVYRNRDYMAVFETEEQVAALRPNFQALMGVDCLGVIATAPGNESDFVSRFFAPRAGINEDPVTGSAHCTLIPYWAARLGKRRMRAVQVSKRRGEISCGFLGDRVVIGGQAVTYMVGEIDVPIDDYPPSP